MTHNSDNYLEVSKIMKMPLEVVKAAIESQFELVRLTIKSVDRHNDSTYKNCRLKHLGLIVAKTKTKNKR